MKLAKHSNALETNAEFTSQDFGIGDASVVIEILRNRLYEHKIRTLVQEYMSNGRDAMREAKTKERIVVSVPNNFSPVFKVRDFGPGITPERMAKVFVKYGSSTKRGSNGQTGGFGIGAKSAWAYTDSFTIVSITNGVQRTYVAHTGVNNQGRLDLISEIQTDEDSGTEIHIAVKSSDMNEFKNAIWRACYFWSAKEYPEFKGTTADMIPKRTETLKIGNIELSKSEFPDYLCLEDSSWTSSCSLIVDGIPYPVASKLRQEIAPLRSLLQDVKGNLIIHTGNGVVEVGADSEKISDSPITRQGLEKLAKDAQATINEYRREQFKKAQTIMEWIKVYKTLSNVVEVTDKSFGGYRASKMVLESDLFPMVKIQYAGINQGRRARGGFIREDSTHSIGLNYVDHIIFADLPDEALVTQNRRIRRYIDTHAGCTGVILISAEEKYELVVNPNGTPGQMMHKIKITTSQSKTALNTLIKELNVIRLSSLPVPPIVRQPRKAFNRGADMLTIHTHNAGSKSRHTDTLDRLESRRYLYALVSDFDKLTKEWKDLEPYVNALGYELCVATQDTINKLKGSDSFKPYAQWRAKLKPDQKLINSAKTLRAKSIDEMKFLDKATDKIKDKFVADMLAEYSSMVKNTYEYVPQIILDMIETELSQFEKDDARLTKTISSEYPLVKLLCEYSGNVKATQTANEVVFYINSKVKGA